MIDQAAPSFLARALHAENGKAHRLLSDLALLATAASIVALFAISEVTLEHFGIRYIDPGGSAASKFHPATFLAVIALGLRCLSSPRPIRSALRLLGKSPGALLLLAATAVALVVALTVSKTPVTGLVDTFVLPVLLFLLIRDLDPAIVRWMALLVALLLSVNAVMGLIEFLRGTHFIILDVPEGASSDPTRGDVVFDWRAQLAQEWRAIALLGHPLVNGLVVGCFIICLAARGTSWLPEALKLPLLLLQLGSMPAFGARSSLVLSLVFAIGLVVQQAVAALQKGARIKPRTIAVTLVALAIVVGAAEILTATGFFDRMIERFTSDDGSAKTRYTMLELFQPLSWTDLMLGPDQTVVATWQRLQGLEFGIESAWVGLALTYGLIVTGIVVVGLAAFSWSVAAASGRGAGAVLAYYFISVSATASLSGKTTSFALIVVMTLLFLSRDERKRPLRSMLCIGTT